MWFINLIFVSCEHHKFDPSKNRSTAWLYYVVFPTISRITRYTPPSVSLSVPCPPLIRTENHTI